MNQQTDRENTLDHERLDAFAVAVELDDIVVAIAQRSGRGHGWIADQAARASASVVLNLAEALGREGADRARAIQVSHAAPQRAPVHSVHGPGACGLRAARRWSWMRR